MAALLSLGVDGVHLAVLHGLDIFGPCFLDPFGPSEKTSGRQVCFVYAFVYICRMSELNSGKVELSPRTVHRLLLAAITVAAKMQQPESFDHAALLSILFLYAAPNVFAPRLMGTHVQTPGGIFSTSRGLEIPLGDGVP